MTNLECKKYVKVNVFVQERNGNLLRVSSRCVIITTPWKTFKPSRDFYFQMIFSNK